MDNNIKHAWIYRKNRNTYMNKVCRLKWTAEIIQYKVSDIHENRCMIYDLNHVTNTQTSQFAIQETSTRLFRFDTNIHTLGIYTNITINSSCSNAMKPTLPRVKQQTASVVLHWLYKKEEHVQRLTWFCASLRTRENDSRRSCKQTDRRCLNVLLHSPCSPRP